MASCVIASSVPSALGTELDPLDHGRPVAEPIHLLPGQHDTHRALQRERRQRGQHHLVLRAQPRAEATAHEGRHDAHIVRLHLEHAAEVALDVLHPLGLVEDRELAVALEYRPSRHTAPSGCDARSGRNIRPGGALRPQRVLPRRRRAALAERTGSRRALQSAFKAEGSSRRRCRSVTCGSWS